MPESQQLSDIGRLREALDAVLVPRGFAAGQGGVADGRFAVVWCAAAHDLAARHPELPTSQEPAEGWGTMCTDVLVEVTSIDGRWRLSDITLEGQDLAQVFAGLGLPAPAERAAALLGSTAEACLALLPPLLTELLNGTSPHP